MNGDKRCIFHVPNYIDPTAKSGSQVRPVKMIEAFKNLGYDVDLVMGYGKERKSQIDRIKSEIKAGRKYEFVYSESSTMPTLLTERDHLPRFPVLDFGFLSYCRKNGIKICLFYRDMHWRFESYQSKVPFWKRIVTIPLYRYDLKKYEALVDVLYLPSEQMKPLLSGYKIRKIDILPPGAVYDTATVQERKNYFSSGDKETLNIFYVGGTGGIYDLTGMFKAVGIVNNVNLTVCTRREEWNEVRSRYLPYMNERIKIVHESGEALRKYYMRADLSCCYFPVSRYMSFAMPIKLFEYLSFVTPVIATKGMEAGNFVQNWDIGFTIDYDDHSIVELLKDVSADRNVLSKKNKNAVACLMKNTWEERAKKVAIDLKGV